MPKVFVKSAYIKDTRHRVLYLRYIATRDGVELLPKSVLGRPATKRQREFIAENIKHMKGSNLYAEYSKKPTMDNASKLITRFAGQLDGDREYSEYVKAARLNLPDHRNGPATDKQTGFIQKHISEISDLPEYEDYRGKPTVQNASELISMIAEMHPADPHIYMRYIAKRPGVEIISGNPDGLWDIHGKADLNVECERMEESAGVVWTHIISMRRDDAQRLGYETASAWRGVVAEKAPEIAKQYNISLNNLCLLGAFHNEGHHPHVHLMAYSSDLKEGVITKKQMFQAGVKLRSEFTNLIFREDMEPIKNARTAARDELKKHIELICENLYKKTYRPDKDIITQVNTLAGMLPQKGRLLYGYMPQEVKEQINETLKTVVTRDSTMQKLTEEYLKAERKLIEAYNDEPEKIESRYADAVAAFYEPQSGKFAQKQSFTGLHNIILKCTDRLRNTRDIKPEVLPVNTDRVIDEPEYPIDKKDSKKKTPEKAYTHEEIQKLTERALRGNAYAAYEIGNYYGHGEGYDLMRSDMFYYFAYEAYRCLLSDYLDEDRDGTDKIFCRLGAMEEKGQGVADNIVLAAEHYRAAAILGNPYAEYRLGMIYLTGARDANGGEVEKNIAEAQVYLTAAACKENPYAQYQLGKMYREGYGVRKDRVAARKYFKMAALNGHKAARRLFAQEEKPEALPDKNQNGEKPELQGEGSAIGEKPEALPVNKAEVDESEIYTADQTAGFDGSKTTVFPERTEKKEGNAALEERPKTLPVNYHSGNGKVATYTVINMIREMAWILSTNCEIDKAYEKPNYSPNMKSKKRRRRLTRYEEEPVNER